MTEVSLHNPPPFLLEAVTYIESELSACIEDLQLPQNLADATTYAVMNGGKRVRPALTLLCSQAVGGTKESALPAAIAVEFIHCFSLVHDDLPSIDDDDLRRGKPTLHIHAGEAMALLAGDILLPLAFLQLTSPTLSPTQQAALSGELADATKKMVVGQVYDTLGGLPSDLNPKEAIETIHQNKTGALIQCACKLGAICGNASKDQLQAMSEYGNAIGLMFQIVDDLIDLHGIEEHVGKATRKDVEAGKKTYPSLLGIEASKTAILDLKSKAQTAIGSLSQNGETLRSFNLWLAQRTR